MATRIAMVGLLVVSIASIGCRKTANEETAAAACAEHGSSSPECARANRGLASGESDLAAALKAEQQATEAAERLRVELEQKGKAAVQAGVDPCQALHDKVMQEFPEACEDGAKNVVEDAKAGVGCAQAIGDWEATMETVPDFLADCPPKTP